VAVGIVAVLVGFLLVSQLRGQERFSRRLQAESEGDLARILSSLNTESDGLRDEIDTLRVQLLTLQSSQQRSDAAVRATQDQLSDLEVLSGTVPVRGPGAVLSVDDPNRTLGYDSLIDVVEELRDAGAEALAINGHRVGVASAFTEHQGALLLDDVALDVPYVVSAIGDPATLESGLEIPGGAVDTLAAGKGVHVSVVRLTDMVLPALARPPSFKAAHPIASNP
jgi:uncharacterized protein YlxW (UPF0749 family)